MKPLEGVTIIDCTAGFAGPICSYQLGLLGAEVIKIEPPKGGDIFRQRAGAFEAVNAGKKSVSLDLKRPEGLGVLARLVAQADVLVDNVQPGAAFVTLDEGPTILTALADAGAGDPQIGQRVGSRLRPHPGPGEHAILPAAGRMNEKPRLRRIGASRDPNPAFRAIKAWPDIAEVGIKAARGP